MNGEITKFLLSTFTHDSSNFHIKKNVVDENYKLHWHNYFEIELIKSGAGYEIINGKRYDIVPGLFYILLPTDLHEIIISEPAEIITISFDYSIIPQNLSQYFYTSKNDNVYILTDSSYTFMDSILEELYEEFNSGKLYKNEVIHSILTLVLINLIRKHPANIPSSEKPNAILMALNYINLHYNENPSLDKVANEIGLSPAYFSTAFKKYSGKTFSEYILNVKISHAKKFLLMNQLPIIDISMLCGFSSISNFNRMFKRIVGCSPMQYKKNNI